MSVTTTDPGGLLFTGAEWDFDTLARIHEAEREIAEGELGLDPWPSRIEVITSEQMLDAYASTGMPISYRHWSFGKEFVRNEELYRRGWQGLAYEIVINSAPCLVYVMEENSATMQALVLAHAAFGHNHFFRHNHVFRQWTDPAAILDYLAFARAFVADCEERHGTREVERLLDAAHALSTNGVHRHPGKRSTDLAAEERRLAERHAHEERTADDLWRTLPADARKVADGGADDGRRAALGLPEENLLYFLEKHAPLLRPWQRELIRIVRQIAQYFYPQRQTKMMNEGCATWVHYRIMTALHERGRLTDGAFLEFLAGHSAVIAQPAFDDRGYGGLNPYAVGFAMMRDIERICDAPTEEDRRIFPDVAGCGDAPRVLREAWANYRDESFVLQFLSPAAVRALKLFRLVDDPSEAELVVSHIHDESGFREVRRALARRYDVARQDPDIEVVDVDLAGDRRLLLRHSVHEGRTLDATDAARVLAHLADLWGYPVRLVEEEGGAVLASHEAGPARPFR